MIFISGGVGSSTSLSTEILDLVGAPGGSCSRETGPLPPGGRTWHTSFRMGDDGLLICGASKKNGAEETSRICVFSDTPTSGNWSRHSKTSHKRHGSGAAMVRGDLFLIGGAGGRLMLG